MKWLTIIGCLFLVPALGQQQSEVAPIQLGLQVNSEAVERLPLISVDGQRLYFVRSAHPQNMGAENLDDIWMAYFNKEEGWKRAVNLGGPLNNRFDNAVIGVDPSGDILYLKNNYGNGANEGIAISYRNNRIWSRPQHMPITDFYNLNTAVDFSVGINGGVLLLSIEQQDGLGNRDLYVSFREGELEWGKPIALGNSINTPGEEAGVYLAPDGKTLFFSSDGHGGSGGLDLFVSKRLDNSWTNWSIPQNLGEHICTADDDYYISVPVNSAFAYLSKKDSNSNFQIHQVQLPADMLPEPVLLLSGKIIAGDSNTRKGGKLTFQQFDYNQNLTGYNHYPDGSYKLVLPYGENMALHAEANGYFAVSEHLQLADHDLEEEDLDPTNMLASVNLDANYIQRDEDISNLQVQIQSLNGELKVLHDQRQAYKKQLQAERAKLDKNQTAYLRTDPELEALKHRYSNFLNQLSDTIPTVGKEEFTKRGIPQSYDQAPTSDQELADMKARFNKHYEKELQKRAAEEEKNYLWEEAIGFDDLQKDVEKDLKKELVPVVTQELQKELINEVKKDLEKSLDKESLKVATDRVNQSQIFPSEPNLPQEFNQEPIIKTDLRKVMQPQVKAQIKSALADQVRDVLKSELTYQAKKEKEVKLQTAMDNKVIAQIRHEEQTARSVSNIPRELQQETQTAPAPVYREVQQDMLLLPVKEGQIIPLNNIFFNPNTAILKPTSFAELNRVVAFLQQHPGAQVKFGGHTNGWSSHAFATKLSKNRAIAVVDYLIEKGIDVRRLNSKGYGKTMPIASNDSVEGRKKNQRIEMKILTLPDEEG